MRVVTHVPYSVISATLKKKKQAVKVTGYTFHHVKLEEGNQHVGHIGGYISAQ